MRPAAALAATLLAGAAFAASDDERREHDAHEHGHGALDIVIEGEELVIELRIPAVNVVGFEHAPKDDAEREAIRQALVPFGDAASLFVLPADAECEVEEAEAAIASMGHEDEHEGEGHGDGDGHDHEKDGHETDEHAKDEHEEHEGEEHEGEEHEGEEHEGEEHEGEEHGDDDGHDHEKDGHDEHEAEGSDSDAEAHSELRATYHFHCHAPERLGEIDVRVFEHLLDAEEIDVRVVTPAAQMAMELEPGSTVVRLSP